MLVGNETGRRIGQTVGDAHILHLVTESTLHLFQQFLVLIGSLLGFLLFCLVFQLADPAAFVKRINDLMMALSGR